VGNLDYGTNDLRLQATNLSSLSLLLSLTHSLSLSLYLFLAPTTYSSSFL
jgi:hypothetical protein